MSVMMRERSGEPWEPLEEQELALELSVGMTVGQIADTHRRTKAAICGRLARLGLVVEIPGHHKYVRVGDTFATFEEIKE